MSGSFCGRYSVTGKSSKDGVVGFIYARLGCKGWKCPICGPRRARKLRNSIVAEATEKNLTRFLTLTMDPKTCTAEQSYQIIKTAWAKFRIYLKRKTGVTVEYIWVLEPQKSGYAHFHLMVDCYLDQRWVSRSWEAVGGGRIVFITQANVRRVGAYLSKYLSKALLQDHTKRGQRRYGASRGVCLNPSRANSNGSWHLVRAPVEFLRTRSKEVESEIRDAEGVLHAFQTGVPLVATPDA